MLKVLVANKHTDENLTFCKILSQDKDIRIINSNTGIQTLNMYNNLNPQVLILDSGFDDINDMSYIEILDRLSTVFERNKCNILITLDKPDDIISLTNVTKIWKIFKKPLNYDKLMKTINDMKNFFEFPILLEDDLDSILLDLNFHLGADGTKYMKTAIVECFYDKSLFHSLDNIYSIVAKTKNKTVKEIRDGMRSSLIPLNKYGSYNTDNTLLHLLSNGNVGTKYFLEVFVTYLHELKSDKK